jgi:hypothetical protein
MRAGGWLAGTKEFFLSGLLKKTAHPQAEIHKLQNGSGHEHLRFSSGAPGPENAKNLIQPVAWLPLTLFLFPHCTTVA